MGGDVDKIKDRLGIVEVVSDYVKLEKAGSSLKARCPFHNEKTPSFIVSPLRQSFYCFGCGAKGDIFTFVEQIEGLEFREALKLLAEKAGVEIEYKKTGQSKAEKDQILDCLEKSTEFFEKELAENESAKQYLARRGISDKTIKDWRIGYARAEWRSLYSYLVSLGYKKDLILKAGLIKTNDAGGEPYDVFRDRIIFPLSDASGKIIAFSGRALPESESDGPKYLNSPDTILFTKSEVLYGLDKAKASIRKKDYAVLVEGQIDLVLSHQVGVDNTVATSGTAFTREHLSRLKHLSSRIILAFDGDSAGEKAATRSSELGIALGFEVKVADLPEGKDPAELASKGSEDWKNVLRQSLPAVEYFFNKLEKREKDPRKIGKQIEKIILPIIKLIESSIEQSHFISMLAKRTGIKEVALWEDLKKVKKDITSPGSLASIVEARLPQSTLSHKEQIEERLAEVKLTRKELPEEEVKALGLVKEELELSHNLSNIILKDKHDQLSLELRKAEAVGDSDSVSRLTKEIQEVHNEIRVLEENKNLL